MINESGAAAGTEFDWGKASALTWSMFNPSRPINEGNLFIGRIDQINRLLSVIYEGGAHAILYGERGVGKTSLSNIIKDKISPALQDINFVRVNCSFEDTFLSLWSNALYDFEGIEDGASPADILKNDTRPFVLTRILESLPKLKKTVFIFDEFDRITDEKIKSSMADTIKYLSDYPVNITIIIIGVGLSITELFGNHPSIQRCCAQINMPRMLNNELRDIIEERQAMIGLTVKEKVIGDIINIAQGLPMYVHLLGREAFLAAIERKSRVVEERDLEDAFEAANQRAEESLKQEYRTAVYSTKPKNTYKEVLLACAMSANNDDMGRFSASDIRANLSKILGRSVILQSYIRLLGNLCTTEHGEVLKKTGGTGRVQYYFANPALPPYIKIIGRNGTTS